MAVGVSVCGQRRLVYILAHTHFSTNVEVQRELIGVLVFVPTIVVDLGLKPWSAWAERLIARAMAFKVRGT